MSDIVIQEVADGLHLLRVSDTKTRFFEALWEIPEGMTYNAYLLETPEGAILFDGWKRNFEKEFVEAVSSIVPPGEIKHIVIHHMEPDHSGTLPKMLELAGEDVQVWGHPFSQKLIEGLYGKSPKFNGVKDGNVLEFGGRKLLFVQMPWLHWPETMVTYLPIEHILLTGDIFGGYSIPSGVFDDQVDTSEYLTFARKYTVTVIGHYKEKIGKNISKLEKFDIRPKTILPAHGLLWRKDPDRIVQAYLDWGAGKPKKGKVTVVYSSMYRFVEKAVEVAVDELKKQGFEPVIYRFVDEQRDEVGNAISDMVDSEAIVLGTETYESDVFPYTEFLVSEMEKKVHFEKPLLLIAVFGWAGAAGKKLTKKLDECKFDLVDTVEFKGLTTPESEARIREGVGKLIEAIG